MPIHGLQRTTMMTMGAPEMQGCIEELERRVVAAYARLQTADTELTSVRNRLQTSEHEHRRTNNTTFN